MAFGGMNRTPAYLIQLRPQLRVGGENRYAGREPVAVGVPAQIEMALSPQIAIPTMPPIPADLALAKLEFQAPVRFRLR
mgnify:CR=1 FL=1